MTSPNDPPRLQPRILVVDDEPPVARVIAALAAASGYEVETAATVAAAIARIQEVHFDAVLADLYIGPGSGLDIVRQVGALQPDLPVVVVTGQATVDTAMDAIREGAYDYLSKPCSQDQIGNLLKRAIEKRHLTEQVQQLRQVLQTRQQLEKIVGNSPKMLDLFKIVARVAPKQSTVLITGESGTGKDMVARALHAHSPRAGAAFVASQLNAVAENLMESELFGHMKGAFTGASANRLGLFQQADRGTLFLDELGELPLPIQGKLLRVLQEHRFRPVGSDEEIQVDVRLVSATNRDLEQMIRQGSFREDLFYRLNVITIHVPPLRERPEDIEALADHFLRKFSEKHRLSQRHLSPEALELLRSYRWPGNVRELEHAVEEAVVLSTHPFITADGLPPRLRSETSRPYQPWGPDELPTLAEMVRRYVSHVLQRVGGRKSEAARILGVNRRTVLRWSKKDTDERS